MSGGDEGRVPDETRAAAVEAAAVPLAIVKSQGLWDKLNPAEQEIVMTACRGQASAALGAALPVLLEWIAEREWAARQAAIVECRTDLATAFASDSQSWSQLIELAELYAEATRRYRGGS